MDRLFRPRLGDNLFCFYINKYKPSRLAVSNVPEIPPSGVRLVSRESMLVCIHLKDWAMVTLAARGRGMGLGKWTPLSPQSYFHKKCLSLRQKSTICNKTNSIHPSTTIAGGERAGSRPGRPPARRTPRTGTAAEARAQGWVLGSRTLSASKKKHWDRSAPLRSKTQSRPQMGQKRFPANPQMTKQQPVL